MCVVRNAVQQKHLDAFKLSPQSQFVPAPFLPKPLLVEQARY